MSLKIIKMRTSRERFRSKREWLNSMHSFSFAEHRDPKWDNFGKIYKNEVQVMSAGTGISHSEKNEENETCKLFQVWIYPQKENIKPRYDQISVNEKLWDNLIFNYKDGKNNKLFLNQSISLWRCKYKPIKEKKLPLKIDKYNWIQIIKGNLLLKSKDSNSNIFLESGDGLGFEVNYYDDVSIDTEKDLDFLLFSMPSL